MSLGKREGGDHPGDGEDDRHDEDRPAVATDERRESHCVTLMSAPSGRPCCPLHDHSRRRPSDPLVTSTIFGVVSPSVTLRSCALLSVPATITYAWSCPRAARRSTGTASALWMLLGDDLDADRRAGRRACVGVGERDAHVGATRRSDRRRRDGQHFAGFGLVGAGHEDRGPAFPTCDAREVGDRDRAPAPAAWTDR